MKNSPILGIFLGIIIVLLIIIFSLGYQVNKWNKLYSQETSLRIKAEQSIDNLKVKIERLSGEVDGLNNKIAAKEELLASREEKIESLELNIAKLRKLKEHLEEELSEELMKQEKDNTP